MTVSELYQKLNEQIPPSLSCEWDNDGLLCCPDGGREVKRVLIALDVTEEAVERAASGGYDVIVSHPPLIFKGLKAITPEQYIAKKTIRLIRHGISVMSFHTRLDALSGGVNDRLAALLGIENAVPFGEEGIGRIGDLPCEISAADFAARVKERLHAPVVQLGDAGLPVRRVAVLGGGGSDDAPLAQEAGADTYVSGEMKYHQLCDAPEAGMNLIEAGHFYTEQPVCERLRELLLAIDPTLNCDLFFSDRIQTI